MSVEKTNKIEELKLWFVKSTLSAGSQDPSWLLLLNSSIKSRTTNSAKGSSCTKALPQLSVTGQKSSQIVLLNALLNAPVYLLR